jgi:hypothetical protein
MNFMVAVGASIPLIFYMGQISTNISQSSADIENADFNDSIPTPIGCANAWCGKRELSPRFERQNIHVSRE